MATMIRRSEGEFEDMIAGKLIVFDSGEYDDYRMHGVYVALQEFDPAEAYVAAKAATEADASRQPSKSGHEVIDWLIDNGFVARVSCCNWYLGNDFDRGAKFSITKNARWLD